MFNKVKDLFESAAVYGNITLAVSFLSLMVTYTAYEATGAFIYLVLNFIAYYAFMWSLWFITFLVAFTAVEKLWELAKNKYYSVKAGKPFFQFQTA